MSERVYQEKLGIFLDLSVQLGFQPSCINSKKGLRLLKQFKKKIAEKLQYLGKDGGSDKFLTKIEITEECIPYLSKNKLGTFRYFAILI